jgi:hypothetical protein
MAVVAFAKSNSSMPTFASDAAAFKRCKTHLSCVESSEWAGRGPGVYPSKCIIANLVAFQSLLPKCLLKYTNEQTHKQASKEKNRQIHKQTDKQTGKYTKKQTNKYTHKHEAPNLQDIHGALAAITG